MKEVEFPVAFAYTDEVFIQDAHVNSSEHTTAHELGHTLGIPGGMRSTNSKHLMYKFATASNPCRVRKTDWDTANP